MDCSSLWLFLTGATALNLYEAIVVPMPNKRTDGYASQYAIELDFIAIAESTYKIALLSQDEIDNCVRSSSFSVCINDFFVLNCSRHTPNIT